MAYKMTEILPNLFLGNIVNSMDKRHLNEFNISHIVSVYEKAKKRFPEREYLLIKVYDRNAANLIDHFREANDFIHDARLKSNNVLVHCIKGVSRSVTIVAAYIMSITKFGWEDALRVIQVNRPIADPNEGFRRQLENFEKNCCDTERMRLKTCFESSVMYEVDEKSCAVALMKYRLNSETAAEGESVLMKTDVEIIADGNSEKLCENIEIFETERTK